MAIAEREELPEIPVTYEPATENRSSENLFTRTLIEAIAATSSHSSEDGSAQRLYGFLNAESPDTALKSWKQLCRIKGGVELEDFFAAISRQIADIDRLLSAQVNEILHHPTFQALEASWRGLQLLVDETDRCRSEIGNAREIRLRVLNVSKRELFRDLDGAIEFDQSEMFRKVYEEGISTLR